MTIITSTIDDAVTARIQEIESETESDNNEHTLVDSLSDRLAGLIGDFEIHFHRASDPYETPWTLTPIDHPERLLLDPADSAGMNNVEFRALLDAYMVADPHPWTSQVDEVLTNQLNRESKLRGFDSWPVAYHEFKPKGTALGGYTAHGVLIWAIALAELTA